MKTKPIVRVFYSASIHSVATELSKAFVTASVFSAQSTPSSEWQVNLDRYSFLSQLIGEKSHSTSKELGMKAAGPQANRRKYLNLKQSGD
jgi:hypothetical protein